jgi:hypothetical protein
MKTLPLIIEEEKQPNIGSTGKVLESSGNYRQMVILFFFIGRV